MTKPNWAEAATEPASITDIGFHRLVMRGGAQTWLRNMYAAYDVRGPLDRGALERAVRDVFNRQPSLRSAVMDVDGKVVKRVSPPFDVELEVVEVDEGRVIDSLRAALHGEVQGMAPTVYRVSDDRAALLFLASHFVFDATSIAIFAKDLSAAYAAHVSNQAYAPAPLPSSPSEFTAWQLDLLAGEGPRLTQFWNRYVEGLKPIVRWLAPKRPPGMRKNRGWQGMIPFPNLAGERFERVRKALGQVQSSLLFNAYAALGALAATRGADGVVSLGYMHNLRATFDVMNRASRKSLDGVIGNFASMMPLSIPVSPTMTGRALLRSAQEAMNGILAQAGLPVIELVKPQANPALGALLQETQLGTGLAFVRNRQQLQLAGTTVSRIPREPLEEKSWKSEVEIAWRISESSAGLGGHLAFDPETIEPAAAKELVEDYWHLFERLAVEPEVEIAHLRRAR